MKKEALVFLPGTLCDERLWEHQLEHLTDVSDPSVSMLTGADTIEGMAESVLKHAPERFALAGLSLGGIVAMEVIRQAPERVTRLALLNSNPHGPKPEQLESWKSLMSKVESGQFQSIVEEKLLPNLIHPGRQEDDQLVSTIKDMAERVGPEGYVQQLMAVSTRSDLREGLRQINVPTLLLVGREDQVCPLSLHEEMQATISESRLVIVDDCGHLSSLERPEEVTAALRNWLIE
ncbi:alpha/beta fold hydrolase [Rossellomorea sp. y25]|uniref:alpha/beta fold hydrolase n=1 Tax=Rossellomorea sp. y25 TaxID=3118174 RepID=UPI00260E021E|nr:alpha/beta fold hydrolase [uncultured Rossellomorea sp.]